MARTFTNLLFHVIFSTKNRARLLDENLKLRLFPYMGGVARNIESSLLSINGPDDHIHMLLSLPADSSIADAIRVLKANSSKWVHDTFPDHKSFAWQSGYSAFTVSRSSVRAVQTYIANQVEHHRKTSFAEEIEAFLRKHGVKEDVSQYLD